MKLMKRFQLWDVKRELKMYEGKVKFFKSLIKHLEKEYKIVKLKGGEEDENN